MQFMNNGFNTFEVNDWTHMQMFITQKTWKISLTCSNTNVRHYVVMYVLIYTNKCNMRHLNNGFNKFKMDDSTNVKIVQEMWKIPLNH